MPQLNSNSNHPQEQTHAHHSTRHPPNHWNKEEKAKLVESLTQALASTASECGKGDIKSFIGVQIDETSEGGYAIGGKIFG